MGRYSNLVLVQNGKIIDALKRVDFEDSDVRQLLPGLPYTIPVSYTHLDVYKRQGMHCLGCPASRGETIAEACEVHGVDCDELLEKLNAHLASKRCV